jgi:hypothetical protein
MAGSTGFTMTPGPVTLTFTLNSAYTAFSSSPRVYLQMNTTQVNANTIVLVMTSTTSTGFSFSATQSATTAANVTYSVNWLAIGT